MRLRTIGLLAVLAGMAVAVPVYVGLVIDGKIAPPDNEAIQALMRETANYAGGAAGIAAAVAALLVVLCAAIAPLLFAIRSGDGLTICVALVLIIVTWALVFTSKTVFDLTVAAVIYLANICLAVGVYATARVVEALSGPKMRREPDVY